MIGTGSATDGVVAIPTPCNNGFMIRIKQPNRQRSIISLASAGLSIVMALPARAQASYDDPAGSGVIVSAMHWLQGTLLGTIATVAAVMAVASVGFLMLTGRINWRYGATVILGCFILFGAASIVAGIQSTATLGN